MSSGGDFFLRLPMLIQSDYRSFPGGQDGINPGVRPNTFILQRVRPMVHFRLWRYFRGFMTPDFGNGFTANPNVQGRVQTPDAFGEWDYFSAFRIRIGKFKSLIGLEEMEALKRLMNDPGHGLTIFQDGNQWKGLTADFAIEQSCADCHNGHPHSPKRF